MHDDKRAFFRKIVAGIGVGAVASSLGTRASAQGTGDWAPALEPQDRWLDEIGGRHRQVFDTITPDGVARALTFTYTFYAANKDAYAIEPKDLGVILILRSGSTPFGFNDKIWTRYNAGLANRTKVVDPKTQSAPLVNIYNAADRASLLPTNGLTLDALAGMGGHFAVCSVSAKKLATALAKETGETVDSIFTELQANTISNARMVPDGIVALNRAQEHHFSLCYTG